MKKIGFAVLALLIVGCEGSSDGTGESQAEVADFERVTLDGYWRRDVAADTAGITFNKCSAADGGRTVVVAGDIRKSCAPNTPDVGSYLINGDNGAILETGTYQILSLPTPHRRGTINMWKKDAINSYGLEYRLIPKPDDQTTLELASPGGANLATYNARPIKIPPSCKEAKRVDGRTFLGDLDVNLFQHDYSAGLEDDHPVRFQDLYAKRPYRFGYPACDVHRRPGLVDSKHYDMVCDGLFTSTISTDEISFVETSQTFPRFYSLSEAMNRYVDGGSGKALTPLIDLIGENVPGCEQKVEAVHANDIGKTERALADALAQGNVTKAALARSRLAYLRNLDHLSVVSFYADNACKVLLSDGGNLLPQAAGQPFVRWVQVFENMTLISNGTVESDQCVVHE